MEKQQRKAVRPYHNMSMVSFNQYQYKSSQTENGEFLIALCSGGGIHNACTECPLIQKQNQGTLLETLLSSQQ
jgi:hypothetical protein